MKTNNKCKETGHAGSGHICGFVKLFAATVWACVMMSGFAFAGSGYTVSDCYWNDANTGLKASWDEAESETDYYVQLYKGSADYGGNKLTKPIKVKYGKDSYNFTSLIVNNGVGSYCYKIWTEQGGEATAITSEKYQVTEEVLSKYMPHKQGWQYIEGSWYLYDASGNMLTGWQLVNDKWYYMDPAGRCLLDTTTPDGYRVDKDGAWIP